MPAGHLARPAQGNRMIHSQLTQSIQPRRLMVVTSLMLGLSLLAIILLAVGQTSYALSGTQPDAIDSWSPLNGPSSPGGYTPAVAGHPTIDYLAYAAVTLHNAYDAEKATIYRTEDGRYNWLPIYETSRPIYALALGGNYVYAGGFSAWEGGPTLFISADNGSTWSPSLIQPRRAVVLDLALEAANPLHGIAGGFVHNAQEQAEGVLYATYDGGQSWSELFRQPALDGQGFNVTAVFMDDFNPDWLMIAVRGDWEPSATLYISPDGGLTWAPAGPGVDGHVVSIVQTWYGDAILVSTGNDRFGGGPAAVWRTTDAGQTWTLTLDGAGGHLVVGVPFDFARPIWLATDWGQVWLNTFDGAPDAWEQLVGELPGVASLAITSPFPWVMVAGVHEQGVWHTWDGGWSWAAANSGISTPVRPRDIAPDLSNAPRLFVAASCGGGWRTDDGGQSWQQPVGISGCMGSFLVHPDDPNVVWGGGFDNQLGAVMHSQDGGLTFQRVYTAPFVVPDGSGGGEDILSLKLAPSDHQVLAAGGHDYPVGQPSHAIVLRSSDAGLTWSEIFTRPAYSRVESVAFDPNDPNTIYAGGEDCSVGPCHGFVYATYDAGLTWQQLLAVSHTVTSLVVDWATPQEIYAANRGYEVWKSNDSGATWTVVRANWLPPDYPPSGYLLAQDPYTAGHVYLGGWGYIAETHDGGVTWSDWGAPLNQGTPAMEPSALAVDLNSPVQNLYAGFDGVWQYTRIAPTVGDRYVALTGSDLLNHCTDPAAPCQSVGQAVAVANPGETIRVAEGTYIETLTIQKTVTLEGGYEATNWTRDITLHETILDGAQTSIPGDWDGDAVRYPMVIEDVEGYRLYYNNGPEGGAIGLATSPDGLTWTRHPANPVLTPGNPGEWDGARLEAPFVLREGPTSYKMWYSGFDSCAIGLATSMDGVTWVKHPANPILTPGGESWNSVCAVHPHLLYEEGMYKMWLVTVGDDGTGQRPHFAYATSPDGVMWSWHPANPVMDVDPANSWEAGWIWGLDVFHLPDQLYQMWYTGSDGSQAAIGYATSPDGVSWTRYNSGAAPVLTGDMGAWDEGFVADPGVGFVTDDVYAMYYDNGHSFGLAHSSDGVDWVKSPANPVFTPGAPTQWGNSVVYFDHGSDGSRLDGFTITGGDACNRGGGGGVGIEGVEVTIAYSLIHHNNAAGPCGGGGIEVRQPTGFVHILHSQVLSNTAADGGGLDIWDGSGAYILDSVFAGNSAHGGLPGGGIEVSWGNVLTIEQSLILDNISAAPGGGIAVDHEAQAVIRDCIIEGNHTDWRGGGVWAGNNSHLTIENSVVNDNTSDESGGGVATEQSAWVALHGVEVAHNTAGWAGGGLILSSSWAEVTGAQVVSNQAEAWAGGVWVASGEAWVADSLVEGNTTVLYSGGGLEINGDWGLAHLTLEDSVVQNNVSEGNGGGLHVWHSRASLTDVVFSGNVSLTDAGGGLGVTYEGVVDLADNLILEANQAHWGGGIGVRDNSHLTLTASVVSSNSATDLGGGLWVDETSTATVLGSRFEGNYATFQGGGLWHHGPLTVEDSVIVGNSTDDNGGGLATCCHESGGPLVMTNSLVAANSGVSSGGLGTFWRGELNHVTVADNTCSLPGCVAGIDAARSAADDLHLIRNAVLWGNTPGDLGCEPGLCSVWWSDIGEGAAYTGLGNLSTYPYFVDAANGDYHLAAWSPVMDAGRAWGASDHDFEGDPRPIGHSYDMGFDEFNGTRQPLHLDIYTDQNLYQPGDVMTVGLEMVNATWASVGGRLRILLVVPGGTLPVYNAPVEVEAKSTFSDPALFVVTLPSLPAGDYAWQATWLPYGVEDTASWTVVNPANGQAPVGLETLIQAVRRR